MSGKRIYELTEKSNLENDYFMALDKSGTANAQKVNVSKILNPINNISGSSDEYSASKAYTKGDLVIHDNKLYVCNTSCSAAAWSTNQGYFTQSTLATEVTNVKSSLTQSSMINLDGSNRVVGWKNDIGLRDVYMYDWYYTVGATPTPNFGADFAPKSTIVAIVQSIGIGSMALKINPDSTVELQQVDGNAATGTHRICGHVMYLH